MKRSTRKKTEKPAVKEQPTAPFDNSEWLDVMRSTLSPYWSARLEHTRDRQAPSSNEEEAA